MKILKCDTCRKTIMPGQPIWQSYYSKKIFCCGSCAAISLGCDYYAKGEEYEKIWKEKSLDKEIIDTIEAHTAPSDFYKKWQRIQLEKPNYRFDLDY